MENIKQLSEIDTTTKEGRYLMAALAMLTVASVLNIKGNEVDGRQLTPDQMLVHVHDTQHEMYKDKPDDNLANRKKRLFEVLDEMNVEDGEKKTNLVEVGLTLISAKKVKAGTQICMGMPDSTIFDLLNEKKVPMLLLVDKAEYFKRTN